MDTPERLQLYIDNEISAAALYRRLANIAEDQTVKALLNEFAEDEMNHADRFMEMYRMLTGKMHFPTETHPNISGSLKDALLDRVLEESNDAANYGKEAYITANNEVLKHMFHEAATKENFHTVRLLYMIHK
jgi:rubrerythrin